MLQSSETSTSLANALFRAEIIKFDAFSRRNLEEAPFKFDWNALNIHPLAMWLLVEKLQGASWAFQAPCQLIAGTDQTIWPLTISLADKMRLQFVEPAFYNNGHNEKLARKYNPGQCVLVLSPDINNSLITTVETLNAKSLRVTDALVLLDYGNNREIKLKIKSYCRLHVIFILPHLLDLFLKQGRIGRPSYEIIQQWLLSIK
jgi:orotate phosphoribosyltransferase